jgi:hypothetical protein
MVLDVYIRVKASPTWKLAFAHFELSPDLHIWQFRDIK